MFDVWNPGSGSIEQIMATAAEIDTQRPPQLPPIQVVQRIFTEPPFVVEGLEPMTVDQMAEAVRAARAAGVAHVVVDTGFTTQVTDPDEWITVPGPARSAARRRVEQRRERSAGLIGRGEREIEGDQRGTDIGHVDRLPSGGLGTDQVGGEVVEVQDLVRGHPEPSRS